MINVKCKCNCETRKDLQYWQYVQGCNRKKCAECGLNPPVAKDRIALLNMNGLTKCSDGLYRLIIPKKKANGKPVNIEQKGQE